MTADTGTLELSRVEAERRRLAGEPELKGAAEVSERRVADVLSGADLESVEVPDDARALFEAPGLRDDAPPSEWARRIVADVLIDHETRPAAEPTAREAAPAPTRDLSDGHRAYWAVLTGDEPLALLPGRTTDPDGAPWAPERDPHLEAAVTRLVDSFELSPEPAPVEEDVAWDDELAFGDVVAAPAIGRSTGRTLAWIALALIWVAAAASVVPFAFEGTEAAVDFTFDIWGDRR